MTVTVIALLKRREGMSKADFVAYYEAHHRRIGEAVLSAYATRYVRRYLSPLDGEDHASDADVITEIDFPDIATRDACFAALATPTLAAKVMADEDRLFERKRIRMFSVTDCASTL